MTTTKTKTKKTATRKPAADKKPFSQIVGERLIEALEKGTAPWQKPWTPGEPNGLLPFNPTTNKRYRGINALMLMASGRADQRWMTYKQAQAIGAQIRKGEKGTMIQYWSFSSSKTVKGEDGKPIKGADGKSLKDTVEFSRPRVFTATVFNAEQIDGLPAFEVKAPPVEGWGSIERAEKIIAKSKAVILHDQEDRAFYRPSTDKVHMPQRAQFDTAEKYYSVLLHELGHWTGHKSRLDRDLTGSFGSISYAKEELRAEIASMIIGDELGLGHDPSNHVAYVASWIEVLKKDPLEIFRAASDAEKIQALVLGFENDMKLENSEPSNEFDEECDFAMGS